jgi:hypothetical protein
VSLFDRCLCCHVTDSLPPGTFSVGSLISCSPGTNWHTKTLKKHYCT